VVVDAREIPCLRFISPLGIPGFIQAYEVVYTYGQTELKAQLRWVEEVCDEVRHSKCVAILTISAHRRKRNGTHFPLFAVIQVY
jgi:hypothetical protein